MTDDATGADVVTEEGNLTSLRKDTHRHMHHSDWVCVHARMLTTHLITVGRATLRASEHAGLLTLILRLTLATRPSSSCPKAAEESSTRANEGAEANPQQKSPFSTEFTRAVS